MTPGTTVQHAGLPPCTAEHARFAPAPPVSGHADIVRLACLLGGAPIALLALEGHDGLSLVAGTGLETDDLDATQPFCAAAQGPGSLEIIDLALDPRFARHRLVTAGPGLRMCAAIALDTGHTGRIGALCVLDRRWRPFDAAQREGLAALARMAVALVETHCDAGSGSGCLRAAPRSVAERRVDWTVTSCTSPVPPSVQDNRYAVAIVELDVASVVAPMVVMQQVQDAAAAVIGHDDVLSRDGPGELLLVLAHAGQAAAMLDRLAIAIENLPARPHIAIGVAIGRHDQDAMEDVFLAAEVAMQQARDRGGCSVVFAAASRPSMNA